MNFIIYNILSAILSFVNTRPVNTIFLFSRFTIDVWQFTLQLGHVYVCTCGKKFNVPEFGKCLHYVGTCRLAWVYWRVEEQCFHTNSGSRCRRIV